MSLGTVVGNDEQIVRILHRDWIVDGMLQVSAFALRDKETYLSVNRPAIKTFSDDVRDFVMSHSAFKTGDDSNTYQRANFNVGEVRSISVSLKDKVANLAVEVEPRDSHYKSHAGIFTRIEGKNIKGGQQDSIVAREGETISYEAIQMKVQYALLALSKLEGCHLQAEEMSVDENSSVVKE